MKSIFFRQRKAFAYLGLVIVLLVILISAIGCTCGQPIVEIIIENQADQVLTIYYAGGGTPLGNIASGEQVTIKRNADIGKFPIQARNAQGEIVFSRVYTLNNLQKIDERTYKAVIPPLQNQLNIDYKKLAIEEGIARLSFEYPSNWNIPLIETRHDYTNFIVYAPWLKRDDDFIPSTFWHFFAQPADEEWPNAMTALEDDLSFWKAELDFKVMERSKIEIGGVEGEQVVFSYRYRRVDPTTRRFTEESEPVIQRNIYFDRGGIVWNIREESNLEVAKVHNVYFEHMLETFKILD